MITEQAYAKINLSLDVTGKRADGYHTVRMVMQSIDLHDTLSFEKIPSGFVLTTDNDELNRGSDSGSENIILKACRIMSEHKDMPGGVKIVLTKRIPIAAGMAGGSTDAAAALRGLNRLYDLGLDTAELEKIGVEIGADVPFCVEGGTKLCEGIGEMLTPVKGIPPLDLVIVKPDINVSTKDIYKAFDSLTDPVRPDVDAMVKAIKESDTSAICRNLGNSLEAVTAGLYPVIGKIMEFMRSNGAQGVLMSGSGPTVYAIVAPENAEKLKETVSLKYPGYYVDRHKIL